jgi:hypothetical protein
MAAANAAEALIFLHVRKSAGTTLNRLIEREYPLFEMYSVDPVLSEWSRARLWRIPQRRLKRFRVFKDHMPFWAARDPSAARHLYHRDARAVERAPNYWKFRREGWTLEDLVRRSPRENAQTKMIAGADYDAPCTAEIFTQTKENLHRHF